MRFHVTPGDELPIYRQIMRQVVDAVAGARIRTGDKLPSHRELSRELVIAPLTVKKAYDELERDGYIQTVRGQGTFVSERAGELTEAVKLERLRPSVQRLLNEATLLNVSVGRLQRLIAEESEQLAALRRKSSQEHGKS